jgi:crotonobetainyl-CoA:carnitine CoA-transferase CaiB-like acyl-CoA transferase
VAEADVVVENFRPGVMDRLGLGWEALRALDPKLIFASISGFGQTGPDRLEAGYDGRIQAASGIMAITGFPAQGPTRAGFAVCDILSGQTCAFAIAAALFQRTHTGTGQRIDVSMLDSALAFLAGQIADWTVAGHRQGLSGNQAVSRRVTANLFRAGAAHILLAVNTEAQYRALMTALGREDALADPRFADWFTRKTHEDALRAIIEDALAARPPEEWERVLNAAGAPCACVRSIEEAIAQPQVAARARIREVETPHGAFGFMTNGFTLAHGDAALHRAAPTLGEDTAAILAELGYDAAAQARLRAAAVI